MLCTRAIIPERYGQRAVRALVLSNMRPDSSHPERGSFVRDQVRSLRAMGDADVQLHELRPGVRSLLAAARELHDRFGAERWDVVHAHFSLTAFSALRLDTRARALTVHGTDVRHPRTRLATRAILPRMDLVAAVSASLARELPGRRARDRALVLPCGVDMERFRAIPRADARSQLGLDPDGPYLLFAADPSRRSKRADRARELSELLGVRLLSLGGVPPEQVPLFYNAANAVFVPSEQEGFGLAVLEALACEVPVLATPVGIHAQALRGVEGALCAPFDLQSWQTLARRHLEQSDPRVQGRPNAAPFSAQNAAREVLGAWRALLERLA